jgi:hypothetical protein
MELDIELLQIGDLIEQFKYAFSFSWSKLLESGYLTYQSLEIFTCFNFEIFLHFYLINFDLYFVICLLNLELLGLIVNQQLHLEDCLENMVEAVSKS